MNKLLLVLLFFFGVNLAENSSCSTTRKTGSPSLKPATDVAGKKIRTGAEQLSQYLPLLQNKNVGLVVNHTSMIKNTHLADTLLSLNIRVKKILAPEHGFRGKADAGEHVKNETDSKTGLPVISLYGKNKKPTAEQLKDLDVLVFDIQDVGVRFYTYISTMHYLMEACAENNKELIILDRPNPNGSYVDGPVLDTAYRSFVGMHPVPIVHGLTVGELAQMIQGEKWLGDGKICKMHIIKNENYSHRDSYSLPVRPSPNLPNDLSIQLYPSLGLFEGTVMSVGRGTEFPFQVVGAPDKSYGTFTFIPKSLPGAAKNPPYENQTCYGIDLRKEKNTPKFTIRYVMEFYARSPDKEKYFVKFFTNLAGNETLKEQICSGMSEEKIRESWKPALDKYKAKRKKYLLYEDFE